MMAKHNLDSCGTITNILSYCHHCTIAHLPSYCHNLTVVLSLSHRRDSPSYCCLPVKHAQTFHSAWCQTKITAFLIYSVLISCITFYSMLIYYYVHAEQEGAITIVTVRWWQYDSDISKLRWWQYHNNSTSVRRSHYDSTLDNHYRNVVLRHCTVVRLSEKICNWTLNKIVNYIFDTRCKRSTGLKAYMVPLLMNR
jgi:hypothetical protein